MEQEEYIEPKKKIPKAKKSGFDIYNFTYELYKAILLKGFYAPLPIQKKALPVIMQGKDAIVSSRTGSGKTLAYVLPMINKLKCHSQIVGARGLIIIPTRQLAMQIANVLKEFLKFTDLKYTLLLGGHSFEGQFEMLASNPDILIATPGRLMQLLVQTDLKLSRVQMMVFDQADNLFQKGFQMQLNEILRKSPVSQKLMFSATIPQQLNVFAATGLRDYVFIQHEVALPQKMQLDFYVVRNQSKIAMLLYLLQRIKNQKIIVFASTRYQVDLLYAIISKYIQQCMPIYGKMDMEQRNQAITSFKNSKHAILIVTDLASRGIDIPQVNYVIHFDYPSNHKIFVHRSGRTARKEQSGHTIALINHSEVSYMIELCYFVSRKLLNEYDKNQKEVAYFGSVAHGILDDYEITVSNLIKEDIEINKLHEVAEKAMMKFRKCRGSASSFSIKQSKQLQINTHYKFRSDDKQEQNFMQRIKNYNPQKSFLQLQKIRNEKDLQNDPFLMAVKKIRQQQQYKSETKKQKKTSIQSKRKELNQILQQQPFRKEQLQQLEQYKQKMSKKRMPIHPISGVDIQIVNSKQKKSIVKNFKNADQYILSTKPVGLKTQFDQLQKINVNEIDANNMNEEGDKFKNKSKMKRSWDKKSKSFKFTRDSQDKFSKEQKGKLAYQKWKKTTHLNIQKAGEVQDKSKVNMAQDYWTKRRKFAKGWKQNRQTKTFDDRNKKKGEVIRKKIKKRLIGSSKTSKGKTGVRKGGNKKQR